ncbi:kinase-like domain-containing protein [Trichophaea hybrida]|nr:kinase-like domain-containing protein [Trichophaea hybrida]
MAMERLDGNPVGHGVPKYVARPLDDSRVMNLCFNPINIKLVDFGESFLASQGCQKRLNTTIHYAAPEILLNEPPITPAVDIWALGCTLYQLFDIATLFEADLDCTDEVLQDHVYTLGIPPQRWWEKCENRRKYFTDDLQQATKVNQPPEYCTYEFDTRRLGQKVEELRG